MTTASSAALLDYFAERSFATLSTTTAALAVVLLLLVAAERELLRATSFEGQRRNVAAFAVVVLPMAFTFSMVIVARFIRLAGT